jgi:alpha-glucosidase
MPQARAYGLDVHLPARPVAVALNGKALPTVEKREEFAKLDQGWYYDARDRRGVLRVKTTPIALNAGFAVKITL